MSYPSEAAANPSKKPRSSMIMPIIAIVILGLVAGVSGLSYVQSNNTIASYRQDVSAQSSSIGSLNVQVSSQSSQISSQSNEISSQDNVVSSMSSEISVQDSTISVLTGQVSDLKSINNLTSSQVELNSQRYGTGTGGNVTVDSFSVYYAGYVLVSMSSGSDYSNEGVNLVNAYSSTVNSPDYGEIIMPGQNLFYPFSHSSDGYAIPVVPGTVTVYLMTSDNTSQTATLSITLGVTQFDQYSGKAFASTS